jgi:hypothetical protein
MLKPTVFSFVVVLTWFTQSSKRLEVSSHLDKKLKKFKKI